MSISIEWFWVPCAAGAVCCLILFKKGCCSIKDDVDDFEDMYCPPPEVPIIAIKPQYGKSLHSGVFEVAFKTTGPERFFWLAAPEIVERCQRHQQRIPFIVGYDKDVNTHVTLNLGDDLLLK